MKLMTTKIRSSITYQSLRLSWTTQHKSVGIGMVLIRENQQDNIMRGIGCPDLVKIPHRNHLPHNFFLFLLKFCIETVLLPQENNRIKGDPLSFGEFLCHIGLWILISCHIGYNRSFFWRIQLLFWEGRQFG